MFNFTFYNPTKIVFGKDTIAELNELVPQDAKVLVLYGGGSVKKFGTLDRVKEALKGREVLEFEGIEPNPQYETLMKAVKIVREEKVTFLLAVGGGSVMDGTKFVSLASTYAGERPLDLFNYHPVPASVAKGLPIGTVVTLPATGSEMNNAAVITSEIGKLAIFGENLHPVFSILDPELTYSLPPSQVANGIIDTFIHVCEQYLTVPTEARFQDRTAEGILQTLIEIGPITLADPTNYDARANLVWCATMALNGLIGLGVPQDWSAHTVGHELTLLHGIDHGKTLAILQPAIWKVLSEQKHAKLLQYAEHVWGITEGDEATRIDQAIEKTRAFFESLGVKTYLSDYGIKAEDIDAVVASLEEHGMTALSESGEMTLEVSRKALELAL